MAGAARTLRDSGSRPTGLPDITVLSRLAAPAPVGRVAWLPTGRPLACAAVIRQNTAHDPALGVPASRPVGRSTAALRESVGSESFPQQEV